MKIILEHYEGLFLQKKRDRFQLSDRITTTDQLLMLVADKIKRKENEFKLKLKRDGYTLLVIKGWELSFYEFRDNSIIQIEILESEEERFQKQSKETSMKYMKKLFPMEKIPVQLSQIAEDNNGNQYNSSENSDAENHERNRKSSDESFSDQEKDRKSLLKKYKLLDYDKMCEIQLESFLKQIKNGQIDEIKDSIDINIPEEFTDEQQIQYCNNKYQMINEIGSGGWNALHFAIFQNNEELVRYFIEKGADLNKQTLDQWTPIQLAVHKGNYNIAQILIKTRKININEVTSRGTALHIACKQGLADFVKLLIKKQASIEIRNEQMKLPHEVCATEECQRIIQIFRQSNQDYKIFKQSFAVCEQERLEAEKKEQEKAAFERLSPLEKLCKTKNIFLPPKPPKVIGNIEKIGSMMFQRLNRFLVVDPDQGALMRFKKKNNYPLKPSEVIPLKEIQNIKIVSPGVFMDPNFNYFEVIFDNRQIFSCKTIITAKLWVYYIYQAAVFASFLSELERQGYDIDSLNQKNSPVIELKDDNQQDRVIWEDLQNRNKIPQSIQQNQQTDSQTQEQKNSSSSSQQNKIKQSLSQLQSQHAKNSVEKKQNDANSEKNSPLKTQDTISGESNKQTKNSKNSQNERMKQMMQPVKDFDSKSQEVVNFQSFDIIKILGQGAFGKVFLVRNKNNGILYAMKALKKKNLILKKQLRFAVTESNVLKNCNSTFVMGLHYAFQTPAYLYLVMDYCPGGDLAQHIMQKGSFDDKTAKFYIAELVLAIENLHSKNIIYRDLKPENILLAQDGHIKLADFGLSKENIGKNENTSTFCGTPAYLSPEMVIHKKASPMSDIYGIGCCLYEMLTGDPPFYTDDIPTMYKQIKDSTLKFPNNINKQTKEFLKRILEKNPEKRLGYKGFQEIKNDPYFKEINFEHVEQKKLEPPIIEFEDEDEDEELAIFNNNRIGQNQFRDTDYTEQNKKINRVIKFTFVRDQNSTQNYL